MSSLARTLSLHHQTPARASLLRARLRQGRRRSTARLRQGRRRSSARLRRGRRRSSARLQERCCHSATICSTTWFLPICRMSASLGRVGALDSACLRTLGILRTFYPGVQYHLFVFLKAFQEQRLWGWFCYVYPPCSMHTVALSAHSLLISLLF